MHFASARLSHLLNIFNQGVSCGDNIPVFTDMPYLAQRAHGFSVFQGPPKLPICLLSSALFSLV